MVEPIGLIGTLIAIVQISGLLVSICYEYRSSVKNAPREVSLILDEATSVRNIIERLLGILDASDSSDLPALQSISDSGGPLQKCLTELLNLKLDLTAYLQNAKNLKQKMIKSTWTWPMKRTEVKKKLEAIEKAKAILELAISTDNVYVKTPITSFPKSSR